MNRYLDPFRRLVLAAVLALAACGLVPAAASALPLVAEPASVSFAPEIVGKQSNPQTVTIANPVGAIGSIEAVDLAGEDPSDFVVVAEDCVGGGLAEGETCGIEVVFEPQSSGTRSATLEVGITGEPAIQVPLGGEGVIQRIVAPPAVSFPTTTTGSKSTQQVPLTNESQVELTISDVKIEGANPGDFGFEGGNCTGPLKHDETCTLTLRFEPSASGPRSAELKVTSDGFPAETVTALSGEGAAPELVFEPASYDFGLVEVHSGNQTQLTLRNAGAAAVQINNLDTIGPDTNEFFISGNNCSGTVLAPSQSCFVQVQFNANNEGSFSAAVRANVGPVSFQAAVSGRAERPVVEPSAMPLDFGATSVGSNQVRELTLNNTGNLPVAFFIAVVSGGDVASFQLIEENCTGGMIAPGESCSVAIRFRPDKAGVKQATVSFFGNGEGGTQVSVEGVGTAPALTLSPSSHDFGTVAIGSPGPLQTFQLRNESDGAQEIDSVGLAGADLGEFAIRSDSCTEARLEPGQTCTVVVRFNPDSPGAKAATLRLRGDAGTMVAQLSGNATAATATPAASAAPAATLDSVPSAGRLTLRLRAHPQIGAGQRLLIGRAHCESNQPCVVTLRGSRVTIAAGRSLPLAVAIPTRLRDNPAGKRIAVTVRWRTGAERGRTVRTFVIPAASAQPAGIEAASARPFSNFASR